MDMMCLNDNNLPSKDERSSTRSSSSSDSLHSTTDDDHHQDNDALQQQQQLLLPTYEQESLFLTMKSRQLQRDRGGVRKNSSAAIHVSFAFAFVVAAVLLNGEQVYFWDNFTLDMHVTVEPRNWRALIYPLFIIVTFDYFAERRYFSAYLLLMIYYPFCFCLWSFLTTQSWVPEEYVPTGLIWTIVSILTFVIALNNHYFYPKWIKSKFFLDKIGAKFFWAIEQAAAVDDDDDNGGGASSSSSCLPWTLTYRKFFFRRYTCQYEGGISPTTGLPDGFGEWIDDSPTGESIIGNWKNGVPMAPFKSTVQNNGDGFNAVVLMYYHATDDTFTKNKSKPTNVTPARMGVASVECSVQGAFYKHVPEVRLFWEEQITVKDECMESLSPPSHNNNSNLVSTVAAINKCLPYLESSSSSTTTDDGGVKNTTITIKSNDPRGIQVEGHVNAMTRNYYSSDVNEVVVQIVSSSSIPTTTTSYHKKGKEVNHHPNKKSRTSTTNNHTNTRRRGVTSMPMSPAARFTFMGGTLFDNDDDEEEEGGSGTDDYNSVEASPTTTMMATTSTTIATGSYEYKNSAPTENSKSDVAAVREEELNHNTMDTSFTQSSEESETTTSTTTTTTDRSYQLKVQDWLPFQQKEALVLLPGLGNSMKKSLKCFGQFIAMTKLSEHVYPIIFGWPTGSVLTYRYASSAANDKRTIEHFLQLIQGLRSSGIRRVHFLSHSMGGLSLIAALTTTTRTTNDDGSSSSKGRRHKRRSPVSNCFQLCPGFDDNDDDEEEDDDEREEEENKNKNPKMICKSIILLNPDYPVKAFVNHAFASMRRICDHITIVGDRNDHVLYYSSIVNGLCNRWGHQNPVALTNQDRLEQERNRRRFHFELRVGKELESMVLQHQQSTSSSSSSNNNGDDNKKGLLLAELKKESPTNITTTTRTTSTSTTTTTTSSSMLFRNKKNSKQWLDMDVIDTTNLDVNFDSVRHSAYNTNPSLVKDLEDIIISGRRAKNRPSLLHREGNIYSYSHVPSFVTM